LGISLVFFTTTAVAITVHYFILNFSRSLAFLLGVIVSPPDATVATGSDTAIKQVERDMDIDDLKFNQLLPREDK